MAETLKPYQKDLADQIYSSGAFQIGEFTLKIHEKFPDAPKSPYYINLREEAVGKEAFKPLVNSLAMALHLDCLGIRPDKVIGIPNAGTPIAEAYSNITGVPLLVMEKEQTEAGRRITSVIHGDFIEGMHVLGVDDLITGADTKFEFKEGLEENKLVLTHMAVGLDREQGGMQKLKDAGVNVSAALTITQLLDYYVYSNRISPANFDQIHEYIKSQS